MFDTATVDLDRDRCLLTIDSIQYELRGQHSYSGLPCRIHIDLIKGWAEVTGFGQFFQIGLEDVDWSLAENNYTSQPDNITHLNFGFIAPIQGIDIAYMWQTNVGKSVIGRALN